jgi:hypothetical protein
MQLKSLCVSAVLTASLAVYAQSPVVGTWKGETERMGGGGLVPVVFNSDGTGSLSFDAGAESALTGIVMEGNRLSFSYKPAAAGGGLTFNMTGEVEDDTLTLRGVLAGGGTGPPIVLSRQK